MGAIRAAPANLHTRRLKGDHLFLNVKVLLCPANELALTLCAEPFLKQVVLDVYLVDIASPAVAAFVPYSSLSLHHPILLD